MSACPFCQEQMRATFLKGLPREECTACGAVWIEGEALAKVMGGSISDALLRRAKDQPGICKGCSTRLRYVPSCPTCGHTSPTCPRCATAPLPVIEALGVKVDVCAGCSGVGLDAGELQQLHEAAEAHRDEGLDLRPQVQPHTPSRCASCKRRLKPVHAFVWGEKFYCGSCAPKGAAPFEVELTRARPSAQPSIGRGRYGTRGELDDSPTESALLWLINKLFG
ncbi:zf-TFIIB domain-containing protein [Hyalangium sp.]|uniref:TFIIB-type zinc ribbon-containing protein n=1 Tax=Hyalangium sp. TaxID=2028555 RepID=UPI002D2356D0|nr:zf-TFIIB domain-containing protein [Hyalangium sp.]HYH95557.1 zf-TFIIB domain-containing protein [Hyalangium sp.]